ncbi:thioredoxin family protein [Pseudomonas sp. MWU13-2517]|uniref:thioredoxin family protein n=1 Tax=Pseudomonas sp. MWU13-2517 TaxID=2929055 RepID=UPI00201050E9|nr:thioredoxin family protein [Pseudomonas sp. MWU13-2517]
MGIAKGVIRSNEEYQSVLAANRTVFLLFVSETCPACSSAVQLFEPIAKAYERRVKSLVLDTATTPRLEQVTGTPTLVTHVDGKIKEVVKGFGPWETQEQTIEAIFSRYAQPGVSGEPA